ncbi:MAG: calcium/sodium antiporter [Planctomycetota bacterium]
MEYLIPEWWFEELAGTGMWLVFVALVLSFAILTKGADWFVDGASGLAVCSGIPKIIIGATIVSIGTTSSEAAVSVMAAFRGHSGLALGNGIGSVICNTGFIFGLCCCVTVLPADRFILARQGWVQFGSGAAFAALCYVLAALGVFSIGRVVGAVLLGGLLWYMAMSVRWARQHNRQNIASVLNNVSERSRSKILKFLLLFAGGLGLVLVGSKGLIGSANQICRYYGVPESIIAATIVAFGTSLPELATAITSIRKGHKELLLGNIIGANILNILFVIGASAAVTDLSISRPFYVIHLPVLAVILILFCIYAMTSRTSFRRWYGVPLLVIYVGYVVLQYVVRIGS